MFELIKSMSMAEKRYFKIFANRHTIGTQNNYITLFDLIEQMDTFDVVVLAHQLEEKNISSKHLSSDKNYLYNLILRGLSAFYAGKTIGLRIKELLHQVEILFERGLYTHCLTLMKKARTQAQKYNLYPLLIEISYWERLALSHLGQIEKVGKVLQQTMEDMAWMDNMHAFMKLYYEMLALEQKIPEARTEEEVAVLDAFMAHPFLEDESIPLSFQAKLHYWRIYAKYYHCVNDREKELSAYEHLLSLMDVNNNYAEEFPDEYVSVYGRILNLKFHINDDAFQNSLTYFRDFPKRIKKAKRSVEARVMTMSNSIEISRLIIHRKFHQAKDLLPSIHDILYRFRNRMTRGDQLAFNYLFAYVRLAHGDYKQALGFINIILNEYNYADRPALFAYSEILNLVIHYHLGNYSVIKYKSGSVRRMLKKEGRLHGIETSLLNLFNKLSRGDMKGKEFELKQMKSFSEEIRMLLNQKFERKALENFDSLHWLESTINNRTMAENSADSAPSPLDTEVLSQT